MNVGNEGIVSGFDVNPVTCELDPIAESNLSLMQNVEGLPSALTTAAQVSFRPGHDEIIVTIKGMDGEFGPGTINRYQIMRDRTLVRTSYFDTSPGYQPFAFRFYGNTAEYLLVAYGAGHPGMPGPAPGSMVAFSLEEDRSFVMVDSVGTTQDATCWLEINPYTNCAIGTNNVGHSITSAQVDSSSGSVSLDEAQAALLNAPIDARFSPDGKYLYALSTRHSLEEGDPNRGQPAVHVYSTSLVSGATDCGIKEIQQVDEGIFRENFEIENFPGVQGVAIYDV